MNNQYSSLPSISIIIPLFNVENYVEKCLLSVIEQDYTGIVECILIDDCSTDNTMSIVADFLGNNQKTNIPFYILKQDHNQGVSIARNLGINAANGDYLFFLDSDDIIYPNTLSLLAEQVSLQPSIDVVLGKMDGPRSKEYDKLNYYKEKKFVDDNKWIQYHFLCIDCDLPITCTNKLIRRELIVSNNIYFIPVVIHEDNHWLFQVINIAKSLAFIFEPTYYPSTHSDSATNSTTSNTEKENWHRILIEYCNNIKRPLRKLKIGKFMLTYFNLHLYEYNFNNDKLLRNRFLWNCLCLGKTKTAIFLFLMNHFPTVSSKYLIPEKIRQKAYWLFYNESMKYKKIFSNTLEKDKRCLHQ